MGVFGVPSTSDLVGNVNLNSWLVSSGRCLPVRCNHAFLWWTARPRDKRQAGPASPTVPETKGRQDQHLLWSPLMPLANFPAWRGMINIYIYTHMCVVIVACVYITCNHWVSSLALVKHTPSPPSSPLRVTLLSPFYRRGNWGPQDNLKGMEPKHRAQLSCHPRGALPLWWELTWGVRLVQSLAGLLALQSLILRLSVRHTCFRRRGAVCLVKGFVFLWFSFLPWQHPPHLLAKAPVSINTMCNYCIVH